TVPSTDFDVLAEQTSRFSLVFKERSIAVFRNKTVLPRAFLVPPEGMEVISDRALHFRRIDEATFDPPPLKVVRSGYNEYVLEAETSTPSVLVLSQVYYPGWRAAVDGIETPVHEVNGALCGIQLPAGHHEVRFVFRSRTLWLGEGI